MSAALPQPMKWTSDRYLQLVEQGVFAGEPIELVFGDILTTMSPVGAGHTYSLSRLQMELQRRLPDAVLIPQSTIVALEDSVPEPDLCVLNKSWDEFDGSQVTAQDIALVVEVSDSSLKFDRDVKQKLYALAGIPEYWIVNLLDRILEVYTEPSEDQYTLRTIIRPGEFVSCSSLGLESLSTSKLFPKV